MLARKIHTYKYIPLPYPFNVENTVQLMNDLTDLPYDHNIKFASLDINNMYSNIPIKEMITILCEISNLEDKIKQDILNITQVIAEKKLFPLSGHDLRTKRRSSNGSFKLRYFSRNLLAKPREHKIAELLLKHKVEVYFRYVDDILIMYKEDQTNKDKMLDDFSMAIPNMKFALEKEENNKINFLDITIAKGHDSLLLEICSKPTTTDVIIPNDSYHPGEHKTAAIRYIYNRMKSYKLTPEGQQKERNTVQQILSNNNYESSTLNKIRKGKKKRRDTKKKKMGKVHILVYREGNEIYYKKVLEYRRQSHFHHRLSY